MRAVLIIAALTLAACGEDGKNGSNGKNGRELTYVEKVLTLDAYRGGPNHTSSLDKQLNLLIPNSIFAQPIHASGSPGWITLVAANKTYCYFASNSYASVGKIYNLQVVRSGNDTSCTTGTATNTSFSLNVVADKDSLLQLTVHTPRIANGELVSLELTAYSFELL